MQLFNCAAIAAKVFIVEKPFSSNAPIDIVERNFSAAPSVSVGELDKKHDEDLIGNDPSEQKRERHYEHSGSDLTLEENGGMISQSPPSDHVLLRLASRRLCVANLHSKQLLCPREEEM